MHANAANALELTTALRPSHGQMVLDGRWRVGPVLGRGATAMVYRGEHVWLDYPVAIKLLASRLRSEPADALRASLLREAQVAARVRHPNLVRAIDACVEPAATSYLVMELVEGTTLSSWIRERRLEIWEAVEIARQIAGALEALASAGIVHRDVSPANIMVSWRGRGRLHATLIDLGVSCDRSDLSAQGFIVGTPGYMAPEQMRALALDARADVYGLGMVLHEALSGCAPARPTFIERYAIDPELPIPAPGSLRALDPECPEELVEIVERATAEDPAGRYAGAHEMQRALSRFAKRARATRPFFDDAREVEELQPDGEHDGSTDSFVDRSGLRSRPLGARVDP